MSVEHVYCPGCAAPISIVTGTTESKCGYCGSSLRIQRSDGEIALVLSDHMTKAFAVASAQTQAAIDESSAMTRDELRRMQFVTEMSNLEVKLTSIEAEIRSVQRTSHTVDFTSPSESETSVTGQRFNRPVSAWRGRRPRRHRQRCPDRVPVRRPARHR